MMENTCVPKRGAMRRPTSGLCTVPTPVWTGSGSTGHCAWKQNLSPLTGHPWWMAPAKNTLRLLSRPAIHAWQRCGNGACCR